MMNNSPPPLPPPIPHATLHVRTLSQLSIASSTSSSPASSKPTSPTIAKPTLSSLAKARSLESRNSTKNDSPTPKRGATSPEHTLSRRPSLSPTNSNSSFVPSPSRSPSASIKSATPSTRSRASSSAAKSVNWDRPRSHSPTTSSSLAPFSSERGRGGSFPKGMIGPPSPPATASDGNSNGSGLTIGLSSGSALLNRIDLEREENDSNMVPEKSRLPFEVPLINRSSPTIAGSPLSSRDKRLSTLSSSSGGSSNATSLHRRGSSLSPTASTSALPRMRSRASLSLDLGSPSHRRSGSSNLSSPRNVVGRDELLFESQEGPERRSGDYSAGATPTERSWIEQDNDPEVVAGERDLEARRAARARRAAELKEKNQRILDSINSHMQPLASPPASHRSHSPRPDRDSFVSRTSREFDRRNFQSPTSLTPTTPAPVERRSPAPRTSSTIPIDDLRRSQSSATPNTSSRNESRGTPARDSLERENRVRNIGQSGRPTPGGRERSQGDQERSYTSMSNYRGEEQREQSSARQEWLEKDYERPRASTSFGTRVRDRARDLDEIEGRNALELETRLERPLPTTSPRRRHSEADRASSLLARGNILAELPRGSGTSTPASVRRRPALPREFVEPLTSSTPSSSAPRESARHTPRSASLFVREFATQNQDRSTERIYSRRALSRSENREAEYRSTAERRRESLDYSPSSDGRFRSPGVSSPSPWSRGKKSSAGSESGGSVGARLVSNVGSASRQGRLIDQRAETPRSRVRSPTRVRTQSSLSGNIENGSDRDEVFRNGLQDLESEEEEVLEDRFNRGSSARGVRQDRLHRSVHPGSQGGSVQYQDNRSRASGSSGGDARSLRDIPQALLDDRTVRSGVSSSQGRQGNGSEGSAEAPGRNGVGRPLDSQATRRPPSARSDPIVSRAANSSVYTRSDSRGGFTRPDTGHYDLLQQAYDRFAGKDSHFPDSADLIGRMTATIQASTKVNSGIRNILASSSEARIDAELDETQRSKSTNGLLQFERSMQSLLRASDDQIRTFTEMLLALTSTERERERIRRDSELGSPMNRPPSRAATMRGPPSPSKRASISSPFEPATVSTSSSRALTSPGSRLRNPFIEETPEPSYRFSSPLTSRPDPSSSAQDSPTPASTRRGNSVHHPSPLVTSQRAVTPSQNEGRLPFPISPVRSAGRRAKSSSTSNATVRPTSPSAAPILFPKSHVVGSQLDATNALSFESPTHLNDLSSRQNGQRTWSDVSAELYALPDAPEHRDRDLWRKTMNAPPSYLLPRRSPSPEVARSAERAGAAPGRKAKQRLSTGSFLGSGIGDILRSSLTRGGGGRKPLAETILDDYSPPSRSERGTRTSPTNSNTNSARGTPPQRSSFEVVNRREGRRRESEELGRRTAGRGSFS